MTGALRGSGRRDPRGERRGGDPGAELGETAAAGWERTREETSAATPRGDWPRRPAPPPGPAEARTGAGPGAAALVDAGAARRRPGGGGRGGDNGTGGGGAAALRGSSAAGRMASDKPGPGLEAQPAALLAVGAGGGGGGGGAMGEPRGAAGSGSGPVVLPAGMINPSVPIRNIRMKFAVLIGLIQVGEVSNRDIVETVLNLVRVPPGRPRPASPRPSPARSPASQRAATATATAPPPSCTRAMPNSGRLSSTSDDRPFGPGPCVEG